MTTSDDEDDFLAHFLESEVLSEVSDQEEAEEAEKEEEKVEEKEEEELKAKRVRLNEIENPKEKEKGKEKEKHSSKPRRIESGILSKIPPELFPHILKFLSSEDLMACSLACKFLNYAASDESLWRRLYCMRWGLLPPSKRLCDCVWKKLYMQRDEEDMVKLVRNCPPEFKEYYMQMHAAKRSQAPLPSQVKDDQIILDKTIADQVSIWKKSKGLTDKVVTDHTCSGEKCSYHQIGDVFVCEKTGNVHVCDDTCREVVINPVNELLVCTISGLCFDRLVSPDEMEPCPAEGAATDEAEPFMGSGRFARAYLLGYNCDDEKELEACLRFC
ncbi:hypothetical protein P3X46_025962 [Hevea brasiliensis]|uniref:F-box domain-containing protein n=1 Tax=Hevea brasiliensis TaxID=3981 RepID=A0ABQ9KV44_HEVBR|nr:F-box protein SKIP31 [Hevea brasiliensis]KAJ9152393.1 hypothetical protein P3X46_025962 [Hevea brasiliensis]